VTLARGRPWLLSLGLHGVVTALVLGVLLVPEPRALLPLRMHLVAAPGGGGTPKNPPLSGGKAPMRSAPVKASEPGLPSWRGAPSVAAEPQVPTVPVSLDELLGGAKVVEAASPISEGWSSAEGEGYSPPPLPPPGLAPPQGARWTLVLSVPGGGGVATHFEGLDSGHPDLDRWLETYLRTVSFPSSLDGKDYQLKWSLRLDTGRPR